MVIIKAMSKAWKRATLLYRRRRDARYSTYVKNVPFPPGRLNSYFGAVPLDILRSHAGQIAALAGHYLEHRFDLLGSGWVQVKHGMHCRGLEGYRYAMGSPVHPDSNGKWLDGKINRANVAESRRIWSVVDGDYVPIDWHLDFKSGYRWSEDTWYLDIAYGHKPGVDIKVPWELARMQHLPQLAWACAMAKDGQVGFAPARVYAREFRNQVLDFIATNPPRYGVNWCCTMDVAIRVTNWLVAYDLFRVQGVEFDAKFMNVFMRSVYEHGRHIATHLEWSPELRGNHYLADIVGLLFAAAYLPRIPETDTWLAFAVQELISEVNLQFYPDGTNFEASTCYHRLAAELVVYATALVLGLPDEKQAALREYNHHLLTVRPGLKPGPVPLYPLPGSNRLAPFPAWYIERLEKMAEFAMHITKPNGHVPQIGDNDSGHLLKLQPVYRKMTVAEARARYANLDGYTDLPGQAVYWDEDHLDHRHLVAAVNGLLGREDLAAFAGDDRLETGLVHHLAGGTRLASYRLGGEPAGAERVRIGTREDWLGLKSRFNVLTGEQQRVVEIPVPGSNLLNGLKLYAYRNFGLYIYRSRRLYLAVRCGPIGQNGNGGHAHNDQLAVELNVDGEDWIADPGTYLYTPLPARRNEYRSAKAHFVPLAKGRREPGRLERGLFTLGDEAKAKCLYFGGKGFIGMHWGYGDPVYRVVQLMEHGIRIMDYTGEGSFCCSTNTTIPSLSPGYGIRHG